jgi:bifunctional non-homologous end joining protein LigD
MTSKLASYRAKRDFAKTSEPSAKATVAAAAYPRFVVQKHAARRLHYDLRLELDGVFKSWAVAKGPSLDPAEKRLAIEVEDHPLAYGDFEGTIPKGEYGGGTVMIWDRGLWVPEGTRDAGAALRKGELKFVLAGEKLRGRWVLVRLRRDRDRGARNMWLLIRHRDGSAAVGTHIAGDDRSAASGRSMDQIAAGTLPGPKPFMNRQGAADPRAIWRGEEKTRGARARHPRTARTGAKAAAAARARPLPAFIAPQLCKAAAHPPNGGDWVHEVKFDGYRMQLRVADAEVSLRTRKGLDWTAKLGPIADAARRLPDAIIDGEVVALNARGVPDFAALQAALAEGRARGLVYFAFDLLFADGEDLRALPLVARKRRLSELLSGHLADRSVIRYVEHLGDDGESVLSSACRMGLEGIISKRRQSAYASQRTENWIKSKCRGGQEVVIGGWSGSATRLRALILGVWRDGKLVHVGQVGTGFNARNSQALLEKLRPLATDRSPFAAGTLPRRKADWTWVEPRLVAEVAFAGWTEAGMVRQAAFKGLREDKPAAEVVAEGPAGGVALARPTPGEGRRAPAPRPAGNVVLGVTISNPAKALWPGAGGHAAFSKLDLARYLELVGPLMIEHIRGRPCSIIRAPDGIDKGMFFQRHGAPGMSKLVTLVKMAGDRKPYVQIDSVDGLIAMAQIAAVEFHPWNCQPGHADRPGRLVFDLDPGPGLPFTAVITAAQELRERIERLGLIAFCKTTGGKGLHVVTPLALTQGDDIGWKEAKAFALAVCTAMARDSPERYLVTMTKKLRQGRIYLDYLRNDRLSTAVAVFSPRARPGAPVSMPVAWSQVRAGLDAQRFTLATVPPLAKGGRAWKDYRQAARPLAAAVRKLVGGRP